MRFSRIILALTLGLLSSLVVASPKAVRATGGLPAETDRGAAASAGSDSTPTGRIAEIESLRAELEKGGDASGYSRLGWLLLGEGESDTALTSFEHALQLNPRSADAKAGKGAALARLGEFAAAETMLKSSLMNNPNPLRAHYELGLLYDRLGAPDKALAEYKAAVESYRHGLK